VTGDRYNQESLAAMVGIPRRTVAHWIHQGLVSPAHQPPHSKSPNQKYYSDLHVRELRALIAIREHNTRLDDLGRFLHETRTTVVQYARMRGITGYA
jgi:DNA-binding transcriptional MerR regulator